MLPWIEKHAFSRMSYNPPIGTRIRVYLIRGDPNDVFATGDYAGMLGSDYTLRNVSSPGDSMIIPGPLTYDKSMFAIAPIVPTPAPPTLSEMYLLGGRRRRKTHRRLRGSRRPWHRSLARSRKQK